VTDVLSISDGTDRDLDLRGHKQVHGSSYSMARS